MQDLILSRKTAVTDYGKDWMDDPDQFSHGLRVWRSGPSWATIQIRHHGPTVRFKKHKSVDRFVLAEADYVTKEELTQLIDHMTQIRDSLQT